MKIAILNKPTSAIERCELTFVDRQPIRTDLALEQHANYAAALRRVGVQVHIHELNPDSPDAVFVEDVAIMLDEVAVITSMGTESRRTETEAMAEVLSSYRANIQRITLPATIEGGDVLRVGMTLFAGLSPRTNRAGITALASIVRPCGYTVVPVRVHGCLHLKTAITALDDQTFLVNRGWIDVTPFQKYRLIGVAADEPRGANVLRIGDHLMVSADSVRTAEKLEALGFRCHRIDISEFAKAEAGLTCMSLIFDDPG